jgi:shikimate dehydrogenase
MKAAVLGSPIAHSLSPVLHRAGYAAAGLDGWTYEAIECAEPGLPALFSSLDGDWAGLSLTMPLKRAVLPLLDRVDPLAAEVGGANTVIFAAGRRHGYNTDVPGMVAALAAAGMPAPRSATILGAGATACSALAALHQSGLRQATVAVRDPARAAGLLAVAGRLGLRVDLRPLGRPGDEATGLQTAGPDAGGGQTSDQDLLISTVPAGAADFYAEFFPADVPAPRAVFDVVYAPWPTPLARAAEAAGAVVISGFELLLHQAVGQFELMTGQRPAPVEAMRRAGLAELGRRGTGPPGHGRDGMTLGSRS